MRTIFLILFLLTVSYSAFLEDLSFGKPVYVNVYVDCSNKAINITSNTTNKYYLFYGEEVIGTREGINVSIPFYGNINTITEPFTLRNERSDNNHNYYIVAFTIRECKQMDGFYIVKMIEFEEEKPEENETTNETEEEKDTIPPIVVNLHPVPSNWSNTSVYITGKVLDDSMVYGYYYKCEKYGDYMFKMSNKIDFTCNLEGIHNAYVKAEDIYHNIGGEIKIPYKIDRTKPIINTFSINPDTWTNQRVDIYVDGYDRDSKIKYVFYRCNDEPFRHSSKNPFTFSCYTGNKADVFFEDNAHNIGKKYTITYKIDRIKPTVNLTSENDLKYTYVWGKINDSLSGVKGYSFKCNDEKETFIKSAWIDIKCKGKGMLTINVFDNAGNKIVIEKRYEPLSIWEFIIKMIKIGIQQVYKQL